MPACRCWRRPHTGRRQICRLDWIGPGHRRQSFGAGDANAYCYPGNNFPTARHLHSRLARLSVHQRKTPAPVSLTTWARASRQKLESARALRVNRFLLRAGKRRQATSLRCESLQPGVYAIDCRWCSYSRTSPARDRQCVFAGAMGPTRLHLPLRLLRGWNVPHAACQTCRLQNRRDLCCEH